MAEVAEDGGGDDDVTVEELGRLRRRSSSRET